MPKSPEIPKIPAMPENIPIVPEKPFTVEQARKEFKEVLRQSALPTPERPRPVLDEALRKDIERIAEQKAEPGDFEETTNKP